MKGQSDKSKEITFTVKMRFEEMPTINEIRAYVKEALGHWGGGKHPDDYMFPSNITKVTISKVEHIK
jgi:hypothetical protein